MTGGPLKPIQVIPPGLVGLLQLKQEGRLPDALSDVVTPVIELRDWYLTARRVTEPALFGGQPSLALATGTTGDNFFSIGGAPAIVPENQIWYVEQMTVLLNPTGAEVATDLIRYAPAIMQLVGPGPGISSSELVGPDISDYTLAARTRGLRAKADRGFWALPNDAFGISVFDIVTTNGYTAFLHLRATVCPI